MRFPRPPAWSWSAYAGFGEVHAARIARLADEGLVELVAAVDPGVALDRAPLTVAV